MGKFESYPETNILNNDDITLYNHDTVTHKITFASLVDLIKAKLTELGFVSSITAGAGLTGGTITTTGTIGCKLQSDTPSVLSSTPMGVVSDRQYAVGLDSNGNLSVNVPWTESASSGVSDFYGTCMTNASTAAKVVICPDFTEENLVAGTVINVKFTNNNTASSPTLIINNTTAKSIVRYGTSTLSSAYSWISGSVVPFVYDGTYWVMTSAPTRVATTSQYGITILSSATNSSSETSAATSKAVKDMGDSKMNINGSNAASEVTFSGSFTVGSRNPNTIGIHSVVEGDTCIASGECSHAEGKYSSAVGDYCHTEGYNTYARNNAAHAEGWSETDTIALGNHTVTDTYGNPIGEFDDTSIRPISALGRGSHAEGCVYESGETSDSVGAIQANGDGAHAEGYSGDYTDDSSAYVILANGKGAHAEGYANGKDVIADGDGSHAEGKNTYAWKYCHAEGDECTAKGYSAHAEGKLTTARGDYCHTEGYNTYAYSNAAHAEGMSTETVYPAHSEGYGSSSYTVGSQLPTNFWGYCTRTISASGYGAHAEGTTHQNGGTVYEYDGFIQATNDGSHAEGFAKGGANGNAIIISSGLGAHAEGFVEGSNMFTEARGAGSHAEGTVTKATKTAAHAEGGYTQANGTYSHSEGKYAVASGEASHAEGWAYANTRVVTASGKGAHAEGCANQGTIEASGQGAHAEGYSVANNGTISSGNGSHAEGYETKSSGLGSHTEGGLTQASGKASHAEGWYTNASEVGAHSEGFASYTNPDNTFETPSQYVNTDSTIFASNKGSHAEGYAEQYLNGSSVGRAAIQSNSLGAHAEGYVKSGSYNAMIIADSYGAHAEGYADGSNHNAYVIADGLGAHAEGVETYAKWSGSHAEGEKTQATGMHSHAEGYNTQATKSSSHAEGGTTQANGDAAHAEGGATIASGNYSHAEGNSTTASGVYSHAEGNGSQATKAGAHAEGGSTFAEGNYSHAEGSGSRASGEFSHAEGLGTISSGFTSHAGGGYGFALRNYQFVQGGSVSRDGSSISMAHKYNNQFTNNGTAAFGVQPDCTLYSTDTAITDGKCSCGGGISDTATVTIDLEPVGMYTLYCSSYDANGDVYGACVGMITATGNSNAPIWLLINQTNSVAAQINMIADNKISIQNTQTFTQFHLIRIM